MKLPTLEYQRRTLSLLVTTVKHSSAMGRPGCQSCTYPSSKCLQRLSDSCALVLHCVHSNRSTTFLVVLAFLWNTGFV